MKKAERPENVDSLERESHFSRHKIKNQSNNSNNENKKTKNKYIIIVILIIIAIALISAYGIARYRTSMNGNGIASVAKWSFNVTAGSSENLSIDLAKTRYENDTTKVDRSRVDPGTKGALEFNVNANESEVSLQYNIDIKLTQIPENLMFYTNEEMTNAIYKEDGKISLCGYFGADDKNKTEKRTLYWQWKYETGSTPEEIRANDALDSKWIDSKVTFEIEVTGKQVIDDSQKQYIATFDLNGGSLANYDGVNQITKKVNYGQAYGELPVPVREGYTFKGWNGKNLFNIEEATITKGKLYRDGMKVYLDSSDVEGNTGNGVYIQKFLNAQYIGYISSANEKCHKAVSFNKDSSFNQLAIRVNTKKSDPIILLKNLNMVDGKVYNLSFNIDVYDVANCKATLSEIQVEENDSATEYEPYYINETTNVTQNKNHTLTAIWEKN